METQRFSYSEGACANGRYLRAPSKSYVFHHPVLQSRLRLASVKFALHAMASNEKPEIFFLKQKNFSKFLQLFPGRSDLSHCIVYAIISGTEDKGGNS